MLAMHLLTAKPAWFQARPLYDGLCAGHPVAGGSQLLPPGQAPGLWQDQVCAGAAAELHQESVAAEKGCLSGTRDCI